MSTQVPPPKPAPPPVDEVPKGMELVNYVAKCVGMGCDPLDVRKQLVAFGFADADAEKVLADTTEWMGKNPHVGQPAPAGPLIWMISHGVLIVGVISGIVGVILCALPADSDGIPYYAYGGPALIAGIFAILGYLFFRVVR